MDKEEIKQELQAFQESPLLAKKPVTVVAPPPVEPIPQTGGVATPAGPCFSKGFTELIACLSPDFIGLDTKDIVMALLGKFPGCKEAA